MSELALVPDAKAEQRKENAATLREYADMVECGDISEFVFVANHAKEKCFLSYGSFDDRWRILGALEYAKTHIHQRD